MSCWRCRVAACSGGETIQLMMNLFYEFNVLLACLRWSSKGAKSRKFSFV